MSTQDNRTREKEEQELRSIFSLASPRAAPPEALTKAVREAVRQEWRDATRPPGFARRRIYVAAAAALLVAVLAVWSFVDPGRADFAYPQAKVARAAGEAWIRGDSGGYRLRSSMVTQIAAGDVLETGISGGVTLALGGARELRVGSGSQLVFRNGGRIDVARGRIFLKTPSRPEGVSALEFHTPVADIRHIGTRFQLVIEDDVLDVAVREGTVAVRGSDDETSRKVEAGRWLRITAAGQTLDGQDSPFGERWRWVDALVAPLDIEGRSLMEVIQWAAQESGREVRFASPEVRRLARTTTLHGGLSIEEPLAGLGMVIQTTRLDLQMRESEIVIIKRP